MPSANSRSGVARQPAQWLEEPAQKTLTTAAWQHRDLCVQRNRSRGKLGSVFASATQGTAKHTGDCHTEERRCDVGSIVDVLIQRASFACGPFAITDQANQIDVEQESRGATVSGCFRSSDF